MNYLLAFLAILAFLVAATACAAGHEGPPTNDRTTR